ncbi:MAG: hypothetical protein EA394_00345 [Bacteroidia bacterium]|nr:MAG: hypothetical protein EA394_00345 [Bacteroidia bacterium]
MVYILINSKCLSPKHGRKQVVKQYSHNLNKPMKTVYLVKTALAIFVAMSITLDVCSLNKELSISPLRFAGIHALSNHQGESDAYLVIETAPGHSWNYTLLDTELNTIKTGNIQTPNHSFFNGLVYNGEYTLLNFIVNAFSQSSTYVVLDKDGHEVARETRTDLSNLRRGEQFYPAIYPYSGNGFIIVQSTGRARDAGYTLEHVDHNLQVLMNLEFSHPDAQIFVYDMVSANKRLYVLEASERRGRTLNVRLQCIDLKNQHLLYTKELSDTQNSYFPTAILPGEDNTLAMAGTYFSGDRIRGGDTRGLFFMHLTEEGITAGMDIHPWRELRRTLRTPVPDWFFRVMPDVHIHAIERSADGNFLAVAELYRYSGEVRQEDRNGKKEQYHRIRMLDFMLFGFDQKGQILYTERIERPHMVLKLDSEITGGSSSLAHQAGQGPLNRARAMKKGHAFTYRFYQKNDDQLNLAFMSYENKTHYAYMMDITGNYHAQKVSLRHAKPAFISYIQIIDLCTNQSGFGFTLAELNTRSFDDSEIFWRGIMPGKKGSMLTYEFMPLNGQLQLNVVRFQESI